MTTIDTHAADATGGVTASPSARVSSVSDWLTTTDHKHIGRLFIAVSLVGLVGVIVIATLLGIERIDANGSMLDINAITQLFSLYRIGLTFIVLVPLLLGIGIAIVPLQLGARSLTFPRLAPAGYRTWFAGPHLVVN
jgi:heme/copper-type cytochrome/quinol oxidase subunit 1